MSWYRRIAVALVLMLVGTAVLADAAAARAPAVPAPSAAAPAAAPLPDVVPPASRATDLPGDWQSSGDRAWTTSGDPTGFHLLIAESRTGYAWRTAASLSEPGFDTDQWIGNVCFTESGRYAIAVYAPRQFTNRAELFERGGFAAVVDVTTGEVRKLGVTVTLAYFNPGCGTGESAVLTQVRTSGERTKGQRTRLHVVDVPGAKVTRRHELAGQVTSAVPVTGGVAVAGATGLVQVDPAGRQKTLAATRGAPFAVHPDAAGGVAFLEAHGDTTAVARYAAGGAVRELARGPLTEVQLAAGTGGRVFLTGRPARVSSLPADVRRVEAPTTAEVSTQGRVSVTHETTRSQGDVLATPGEATTVRLSARVAATGKTLRFGVTPGARPAAQLVQGRTPARLDGTVAAAAGQANTKAAAKAAVVQEEEGRYTPIDPLRTCAVARNDARTQVYQPYWRQVEWAADQAVVGRLTTNRPANWKESGLPAWAPQGMFPRRGLVTGASHRVPAQVLLGVLAQESNLWQSSSHALEGNYGNPLIGNYYGRDIYNDNPGDDWIIRWDKADCGYGVAQVTDGMRQSDTSRTAVQKRAIAVDYATNIAAGLQILEEKWNAVRTLNIKINNDDPARPENWFAALWAYNTGIMPRDAETGNPTGCTPSPTCHDGRGNYGLGWTNNPVSSMYPANRTPFLNGVKGEGRADDARHPQDWPYPEKVLGWAAFPIIKTNPFAGTYEAGYRQAWWNLYDDKDGNPENDDPNRFRTKIKPPRGLFCNATNHCDPNAAQPCAEPDFHCWWTGPAVWKPGCAAVISDGDAIDTVDSCGHEGIRYDPGLPEPADWDVWYRPNCRGVDDGPDAPSGAWVVDDVHDSMPSARPCADPVTNSGEFKLEFAADETGKFRSKIDFHQIGGGYAGHFWFAHTYRPTTFTQHVTGTWAFSNSLNGWGRVLVHVPDHQSHTAQAAYDIWLGDGTKKRRVVNLKSRRKPANGHRWVSLGVFQFKGQPKVVLDNQAQDGDADDGITWDAVAVQPLAAKPRNVVVALGDSYSSGEGSVGNLSTGADYWKETDVDGDLSSRRNNCHRSVHGWQLNAKLADNTGETIWQRESRWDATVDFHELSCSGAQTEQLLPDGYTNAFGDLSKGQDGEVSQLSAGFLDEATTLVTLSVGGNDAGWSKVIEQCLKELSGNCQDQPLEGETLPLGQWLTERIDGPVFASVQQVLGQIHRLAPNAKIVLMGYPALLSNDAECVRGIAWKNPFTGTKYNLGITATEAGWLNAQADVLAQTMSRAAQQLRTRATDPVPVFFADPRPEFAGHGICSLSSRLNGWVPTLSPGEKPGLGEDFGFPELGISQQSFHPNVEGAAAYTRTLVARLRQPDIGL
jgi:hypothetical protein